jgi:hypothetical protein
VVHGFTLLRDAESVRDIFEVLFTRFEHRKLYLRCGTLIVLL